MTRPAPWRRSTVVERRRHRRDQAARKAAYYASESYQARRLDNAKHAAAGEARAKIKRALAGDTTVQPLTPRQYEALNPARQQEAIALGLVPTLEQWASVEADRERRAAMRQVDEIIRGTQDG